MDKKDIYEHLAKIYLDASSKGKKSGSKHNPALKKTLIGAALLVATAIIFLLAPAHKQALKGAQIVALVLQPETIKLNFHFDPAKKEIYTLNLNKIDLSRFQTLSFSVRKENIKDKINLRVELATKFKEKASCYIRDIPHRWQNYQLKFLEFKGIGYLGSVSSISFIVEEWNTREKNGVVYIDDITLLK